MPRNGAGGHRANGSATGGPELHMMTKDEARQMFERQAQRWLGMNGEEFLRRWESGQYDETDDSRVLQVALLVPLVR